MTIRPTRVAATLAVAASLTTAGSLSIATGLVEPPLDRLAPTGADVGLPALLLVAVVAVSQLALLRVRVGGGEARVAWGEAAIVILCVSLPPSLVGPVVLVGVAIAQAALHVFDTRRGMVRAVHNVSALTLAGTAAALTSALLGPTYGAGLDWPVVLAVCAGAVAYFLVSVVLVAVRVAMVHGGTFDATLCDVFNSKALMVVGNVAIGLLVVWVCATNVLLLVLLPPVLWLLHQFYANRLRGDDERRTWQAFTEATRELNRLDEHGAATAGAAGAKGLFRASAVSVVVDGAGERARVYGEDLSDVDALVRPLVVGQVRVGELRLSGVPVMRPRDRLMLGAYGDALAAALHDALTHDELRAMGERTTYDAVHDPLTGLVNRGALLTRGNNALRQLAADEPVALMLLDINDFKEVNNTLGHTAGDELLQVIARRVRDLGGAGDLLARLGGDEFALLVTDLSTAGGGDLVLAATVGRARRLSERLAAPTEVAGVALSKEASIGVVVALAGDVDMTELLRRADIAMYQAKRGGQPVAWYDAVRDEASTDRLALLAELREALAGDDQLTVELQPAVSLEDGSPTGGYVTGVEALLRWRHPRRGLLTPEHFLPTVEQSELIGPLTLRVLDRALGLAAGWHRAGLTVPVAVNISARNLCDRQLPIEIESLLERHRLPARLLVLEITETVVMSKSQVIDDVLGKIKEIGVQLAVDDFGTGYSSLTFLTRIPVDEVKIDRSFIAQMVDSPEAAAIVRTTIGLARELNLRVVAEGVETAEQRARLVELGCTAAQGYHFYPPMAATRVTTVLRERQQKHRRYLRAEGAG